MTTETMRQIAQDAYDRGDLNLLEGTIMTGVFKYNLKDLKALDLEGTGWNAIIGALEGSIPVWRDAKRDAPPKQELILTNEGVYVFSERIRTIQDTGETYIEGSWMPHRDSTFLPKARVPFENPPFTHWMRFPTMEVTTDE